MRIAPLTFTALLASSAAFVGAAQQAALPADPGVYAETASGAVPLKKTFSGFDVAGSMSTSTRTRVLVFPISTVDDLPAAPGVAGFIVNLATVDDSRAAASQMRFAIGDHVREPDFQVMAVTVGKFRTGVYRISSPQLTHEWLAGAYAKLTSARKWRDKRPPAIVGLILNDQMYPVRIEEAALTVKEER
jgi:hypothetical protein